MDTGSGKGAAHDASAKIEETPPNGAAKGDPATVAAAAARRKVEHQLEVEAAQRAIDKAEDQLKGAKDALAQAKVQAKED